MAQTWHGYACEVGGWMPKANHGYQFVGRIPILIIGAIFPDDRLFTAGIDCRPHPGQRIPFTLASPPTHVNIDSATCFITSVVDMQTAVPLHRIFGSAHTPRRPAPERPLVRYRSASPHIGYITSPRNSSRAKGSDRRIAPARPAMVVVALLALLALYTSNPAPAGAQSSGAVTVAAVKYGGGGDWYQARSPLPNFLHYVRENTLVDVAPQPDVVELSSDKLFSYPFIFISGHGNIVLNNDEVRRLRRYLENGGFLYVDDDYGLDEYIRREMKKVFPEQEFVELPFSHELYHTHYEFPNGLPKIHEHDGEPPQGFGLFHDGRLVVYYTYETNLSDGWESPEVHNTPADRRDAAFRMGTNILTYALMR